MSNPTDSPEHQFSPAARATRIIQEVSGVWAGYGITDWEKNFILSNSESTWPTLTDKQEAVMQRIEAKVFDSESTGEDDEPKALDGKMRFR